MHTLRNPYWLLAVGIALAHQLLQYGLDVRIPFLDNYLDPLLALPVFLGLWQIEREVIFGVRYLSAFEIVLGGLFITLVGEWLFPYLSADFVHDYLDYPMYALGGVYFWWHVAGGKEATASASP